MWLIVVPLLLLLLYYYILKPLKYWQEKEVVHEKPLPIVGNMLSFILKKFSFTELLQEFYKNHPNARYIGIYNFNTPLLMLTDPELIKKIMVKEFETFPEHRQFVTSGVDPLWSKNLFAMEGGEEWHELRATLSPSFTSSKMKAMFVLMKECSIKFSNYYKSKSSRVIELNVKDVLSRFANDVIATCAFGVTCDSQADSKNKFYLLAKKLTNFSGIRRLSFLVNICSPMLGKILKLSIVSNEVREFFTAIVTEAIRVREEKNIVRPDMLHLLMESRKGQLKYEEDSLTVPEAGYAVVEESEFGKAYKKTKIEITDEVITAQVLVFFFAGFDTVSTMMSYAIYELGVNPEIQERLRDEIDNAVKLTNGELTYDNLMGMKYLDMVVSETLRKWPPLVLIDRKSKRPYVIEAEKPGEKPLYLEKGSLVFSPVYCIHRDEEYYPNPDKFDPERFSEDNRNTIKPYTYIPFGSGPRNCIGSRFALLEGKLIIAETVKNFEIVPTSKTQIPIVLSKSNFNPLPDNGIWVGLKRRELL